MCFVPDTRIPLRRMSFKNRPEVSLMTKRSIFHLFVLLAAVFSASEAVAQEIPPNASLNAFGEGWVCNVGFRVDSTGTKCIAVVVPENATLDYTGRDWTCARGFKENAAGTGCIAVNVPANATVDYTGRDWTCLRGFRENAAGTECVAIDVPANAEIDYTGRDWTCLRGFRKDVVGTGCIAVVIPENATLDYTGHDWACRFGFKKSGGGCIAMTLGEIEQQVIAERAALIAAMERSVASGDDCETEYKTNAAVCVSVIGANLDCDEDYSGDYYDDCSVSLDYRVETDYAGGASLSAYVDCSAGIEYRGRNSYFSKSDYNSTSRSHDMYANDRDGGTVYFDFSFGYYEEVSRVQISSVECEVDSVDLR